MFLYYCEHRKSHPVSQTHKPIFCIPVKSTWSGIIHIFFWITLYHTRHNRMIGLQCQSKMNYVCCLVPTVYVYSFSLQFLRPWPVKLSIDSDITHWTRMENSVTFHKHKGLKNKLLGTIMINCSGQNGLRNVHAVYKEWTWALTLTLKLSHSILYVKL